MVDGPVVAGGHSYGGRMTSMAVADGTARVDVLTLFSYPLHPPGKPERARTEHLPRIAAPTVFTHGTSDPFGSIDELRAAAALMPPPPRSSRSPEPATISAPRHSMCRARRRCGATVAPVTTPPGPPPYPPPPPRWPYPPPPPPSGAYPPPPPPYGTSTRRPPGRTRRHRHALSSRRRAAVCCRRPPAPTGGPIISLIFGVIGGVLISVVCGIVGLNRAKQGQGGRGMAIAGLVLSALWAVGIVVAVAALLIFGKDTVSATEVKVGRLPQGTARFGAGDHRRHRGVQRTAHR